MTEDPITVAAHEIRDLIDQINGTWLKGRSADLDPFFHEDVVVQPPGDSLRVHGKASCIASYDAFTRQAHVRQFTPGEAEIDVFGDTDSRSHSKSGARRFVLRTPASVPSSGIAARSSSRGPSSSPS